MCWGEREPKPREDLLTLLLMGGRERERARARANAAAEMGPEVPHAAVKTHLTPAECKTMATGRKQKEMQPVKGYFHYECPEALRNVITKDCMSSR